mmetsp:Transcript_2666/g.7336  ORF Transcript_2666/g.7336 Transcript_2666/m.7336 type:complete len:200 (+) Transcript_2666:891-1490(+)
MEHGASTGDCERIRRLHRQALGHHEGKQRWHVPPSQGQGPGRCVASAGGHVAGNRIVRQDGGVAGCQRLRRQHQEGQDTGRLRGHSMGSAQQPVPDSRERGRDRQMLGRAQVLNLDARLVVRCQRIRWRQRHFVQPVGARDDGDLLNGQDDSNLRCEECGRSVKDPRCLRQQGHERRKAVHGVLLPVESIFAGMRRKRT